MEELKNLWWRPPKYKTPKKLWEKFIEYVEKCENTIISRWINWIYTKPLTISGFCIFAWVSRDYLSEKEKLEEFSDTVRAIRQVIENDVEEKSLLWVYSPTISSFNLKYNFGWKDKIENETTLKMENIQIEIVKNENKDN